ncbi:uncharacterized protein YrzB (UPF0473 family) [Melghirimyces profundicolus]|uniref:UPF0473 protein C8P63_11630 n=1 Tax=Melghirimyces profundicolus TaxID=1242148 RepID=A0A2T6BQR6_9BACL|nr:DUF1292 domain-containing protein [Melghirimyces profundicolus]PTX58443.1 uncharacterized protein YrzB (UPF0473 family) [Melghirimyces profundicolus]
MPDDANHEHQQETVIISNEEGEQETFEVLYRFERDNGHQYILLTPVDEEEAADDETVEQEVYAFRYEGDGENINLIPIEDDSEWDMIEEVLHTLESEWNDDEDNEG